MFGREPRIPVDKAFEVTFPFRQEKNMYMTMCIISGKDYNGLTILLKSILIKMLPDINFTMIGNIIAWKLFLVILYKFVKKYLVPTIRLLISGKSQYTKCLRSMVMDQYSQFKELDLVVIIQLRTFIVICYNLS